MMKSSRVARLGCALVLGFGLVSPTFAADKDVLADKEDILVTDPGLLEDLGFDRDAENVFMAPNVDLEGADGGVFAPAFDLEAQTNLFPSGSTDYSPVAGKEFAGRINTAFSPWLYGTRANHGIYRIGTQDRFADGQVGDLPNGGRLDFLRVWWFDALTDRNLTVFLFETCQPGFVGGVPVSTVIGTVTSSGFAEGSGVVSLGGRSINTRDCIYVARVRFDDANFQLALHKVRVQFRHP